MKFELDTLVKGVYEDTLARKGKTPSQEILAVPRCGSSSLAYVGSFLVAASSALAGRPGNLELDLSCNPDAVH